MKESNTCQRCNKTITETDKDKHLCNRCKDVLEFGYPSFPSYQLEEYQTNKEKKDVLVPQLI
jgi:phage FluMu protein Com